MTSQISPTSRQWRLQNLLFVLVMLGGCASVNSDRRDPLEPMNRVVYKVNDGLDRTIFKPVATAYQKVLPLFVRSGVSNFFDNLYDIPTALNNLLQGKITEAGSDIGRVALNTTIGIAGLIDVGTKIGLEKHREDFGQTLGRWGISDGPYLQILFLGPRSFRDAVGTVVDLQLDPINRINNIPVRNSLTGLNFVNLRENSLYATQMLGVAALDPYEFQRDAYLQRRRNLVYDGAPPAQKDDMPELKTKPRARSEDAQTISGTLDTSQAPTDAKQRGEPLESHFSCAFITSWLPGASCVRY